MPALGKRLNPRGTQRVTINPLTFLITGIIRWGDVFYLSAWFFFRSNITGTSLDTKKPQDLKSRKQLHQTMYVFKEKNILCCNLKRNSSSVVWWWELGQNLLILTFHCPMWAMWVLRDHKNTLNYDCLFHPSLEICFLCPSHTEYWARRLQGGLGYRNSAVKHQTHLRTATSFLKAWNCSGVGSTTFRIFTATSPGNKKITPEVTEDAAFLSSSK